MTESERNLAQAFASESVMAAKNAMHALKADKEGHRKEAVLFRALASGQQVHAKKALMLLRGRVRETSLNFDVAMDALDLIIDTYRESIVVAARDKSSAIESALAQFLKTAMNHKSVLGRIGKTDAKYHVCRICGFIAEGKVPEQCPVCRAVPEQFQAID